MLRFLPLLLLLAAAPAPAAAQRVVAVTFDDLPYVGASLDDARHATDALLAALATHGTPADVFVEGHRVEVAGEAAERRALLRRWHDAGHALQNHSYSHPRYSSTTIPDYLRDVARGHRVVADVLSDRTPPGHVGFFRPPYNDLGETQETRAALAAALDERGVRLAPFTVEHADWMFNAVYEAATARGDTALARRVGRAYLAQLDSAFVFAERLADETFGSAIPHVLLLHANRINADHLGAMLARLRARGYAFVSLAEAAAHPAYRTPDHYTARWGVSWLHRWRVGLGLPNALRREPEPPAWLVDAYESLSS